MIVLPRIAAIIDTMSTLPGRPKPSQTIVLLTKDSFNSRRRNETPFNDLGYLEIRSKINVLTAKY